MGMAKAVGIAMVGHAFMGRAHANAIRQVGHFFDLPFELVARVVVGRDTRRVEAARKQLGFVEASTDLAAVLARKDVQIIDIATPNDSHAEIALSALSAGKHVLCEKPLAMDLKQARSMASLAARKKVKVGLWHNYRRCPAASLGQRMIERGDIGEVRHVRAVYLQDWLSDPGAPASWRTRRATSGSGAHGDLNAHLIDMTHFLTGLSFEEVSAMDRTFVRRRQDEAGQVSDVDVDDAMAFLARLSGGAIGTFEATRMAPGRKNFNQIEVNGSEGSIRWNLEEMNELYLFRDDEPVDSQGSRRIMCTDANHPYAAHWWPDGHLLGYEHSFVHTLADFLDCLLSEKPFSPDFADGVRVQAVLDAVLESARTRTWIEVPS